METIITLKHARYKVLNILFFTILMLTCIVISNVIPTNPLRKYYTRYKGDKICLIISTYLKCNSCHLDYDFINFIYEKHHKNIKFILIVKYCGNDALQTDFNAGLNLRAHETITDSHFDVIQKKFFPILPALIFIDASGQIVFSTSKKISDEKAKVEAIIRSLSEPREKS